ncbi:YTX2-like protein, partial [Mya arenaria]
MALNIFSLNINGLRSKPKQSFIKDFISANNVDILCLQETHINNFFFVKDIEIHISNKYRYIWSYGFGQSAGTCVIIINDKINIESFQTDFDGRFLYLDLDICDFKVRLCNIYAPNVPGERNEYFTNIKQFFVTSRNLIILGDFNFIFDTRLDKIGGNVDKGSLGSKIFSSVIKNYGLFDVYRNKHPNTVKISWCKNGIGCRLDRIYFSLKFKGEIIDTGYMPCPLSDHDFVYFKLPLNNDISIGKSYWKLNNSILSDEDFQLGFKFYWKIISRTDEITLEWWDKMKLLIKEFCIDYSKCKNIEYHKELRNLIKEYQSSASINERIFIKSKISELYKVKHTGALIRSKVNMINHNENISSFYHDVEFSKNKDKIIYKIVDNNREKNTSLGILDSFRNFYKTLYAAEYIDNYIEQKDITACFINLDQEKAFDKVSWPYMFSVLQSFGFDDKFIKWIKVLYNDVSTSVI